MRFLARTLLAATCLGAVPWASGSTPSPVSQVDFDRAVARATALVDASRKVEGASPAIAVIFVRDGVKSIVRVEGVADVRTGVPADGRTAFYVASMTKAFVGLLAAKLDVMGVLPLDTTLAAQWPDLRLPGDIAATVTLRDLLVHRAPFENSTLAFRTSYTDAVPAADYPRLLSAYSGAREPGFRYDNLGYLVWAAVLEQRTGRSWHDWLADELLSPMGMQGTASDASTLPGTVALPHQWTASGWRVDAGKPAALMHPAGGMVVSPDDMARWLQAHLDGHAAGMPDEAFALAHQVVPYPAQSSEGQDCDGYALGWNRCTAWDIPLLAHGGSYDGFRSRMAIAPAHGVGIAVLTNTDAMTGALSAAIVDTFLSALSSQADAAPAIDAVVAKYGNDIKLHSQSRHAAMDSRRAEPYWEGWQWHPAADALAEYAGEYADDRMGTLVVAHGRDGLHADLGEMRFVLDPARPDLFGGSASFFDAHDRFTFERDAAGRLVALDWGGRRFARRQAER